MKLILKEEVDNLGLPGDVVDVAAGYGRNFLIPRGFAIRATPGAMKEAEALTRARKAREAETIDEAQEFKQTLESRDLRIEARVDEHGTLYGSVGPAEVQKILKERGHTVERRRIDLPRAIKTIGEHEVSIKLHPQVTAEITVHVVDVAGEVTVESLAEQRMTEAERRSALEEGALEAAEEIEAAEAEEEAAEDVAADEVEDAEPEQSTEPEQPTETEQSVETEDGEPMSPAEALAARASAPSDVDAPARPEDLATEDESDDESDDEEPTG